MAQKNATMLVVGNCVKQRQVKGDFTNERGEKVEYDYIEVRVLTPEVDVVDVRFPSNGSIKVPDPDEQVTIRCDVRGSGGNIKVTAEALVASVPSLV